MKRKNTPTKLMPLCLGLFFLLQTHAYSDNFQDGTVQGWTGSDTANLSDVGPMGLGDHSLEVTSIKRFVTYNQSQWSGDWNSAGIHQLAMDVKHNNPFDLVLWLGISQGSPLPAGQGDNYVTDLSVTVPGDNNWHSIVFDVTPTDFSAAPSNNVGMPDVAAALSSVQQLRIIHNPTRSFLGTLAEGTMLVDNIRVVPEPTSLFLASLSSIAMLIGTCRRRQCLRLQNDVRMIP